MSALLIAHLFDEDVLFLHYFAIGFLDEDLHLDLPIIKHTLKHLVPLLRRPILKPSAHLGDKIAAGLLRAKKRTHVVLVGLLVTAPVDEEELDEPLDHCCADEEALVVHFFLGFKVFLDGGLVTVIHKDSLPSRLISINIDPHAMHLVLFIFSLISRPILVLHLARALHGALVPLARVDVAGAELVGAAAVLPVVVPVALVFFVAVLTAAVAEARLNHLTMAVFDFAPLVYDPVTNVRGPIRILVFAKAGLNSGLFRFFLLHCSLFRQFFLRLFTLHESFR